MTDQFDISDAGIPAPTSNSTECVQFRIVDLFPPREQIGFGDLLGLSLRSNTASLTHGLHRFPAKFIPQIPRWAIAQEQMNHRPIVLDPFMGSGTTLVEAACRDGFCFGIDLDPLATFISSTKVAQYSLNRLNNLAAEICATQGKKTSQLFLPMDGVSNASHWFAPQAHSDLCVIFDAIQNLECSADDRRFFLCVFSSILRTVSNADDQTQKTYVSHTLIKQPPNVWLTFKKQLTKAISRVAELVALRKGGAVALRGSATALPLEAESVDLIVTSPPYMDSVDYMYNLMLEYFWLGPTLGIDTRHEFNRLRRESIGAKNPKSKEPFPNCLKGLVEIEEVAPYRRDATNNYFTAMARHFEEAARVLKPEARYVFVIGNSVTRGDTLRVHDCLIQLARESGLQLEHAFGYRIRRHYMKFPRKGRGGIILMDWVITLRKSRQSGPYSKLPLPPLTIGDDEVAH